MINYGYTQFSDRPIQWICPCWSMECASCACLGFAGITGVELSLIGCIQRWVLSNGSLRGKTTFVDQTCIETEVWDVKSCGFDRNLMSCKGNILIKGFIQNNQHYDGSWVPYQTASLPRIQWTLHLAYLFAFRFQSFFPKKDEPAKNREVFFPEIEGITYRSKQMVTLRQSNMAGKSIIRWCSKL